MEYNLQAKARADLIGFAEQPESESYGFNVKEAAMNLTRKVRSNREELLKLQVASHQRTSNLLNFKPMNNKTEVDFSLPHLGAKKAQQQKQLQLVYHKLSMPNYVGAERMKASRRHRLANLRSPPISCVLPGKPEKRRHTPTPELTKAFVPRLVVNRRTLFEGLSHARSISHNDYDF